MKRVSGRATSSLTGPLEPDVLVPAGLLEAAGGLSDEITTQVATDRLRELLSPAALWVSKALQPEEAAQPPFARLGHVPRWQSPPVHLSPTVVRAVRAAWEKVVPARPARSWGAPVLRLCVDEHREVEQLGAITSVRGRRLVPSLAKGLPSRFAWRWPLRVGVAAGARSAAWLAALLDSRFSSLFDARVADQPDDDGVDIILVDADEPLSANGAVCVMLVSDRRPPGALVDLGRTTFRRAAFVAGVPADGVGWFDTVVQEMAHDQPLDVALRMAVPASVVAGDEGLLNLTAVRQWAFEVERQIRPKDDDDARRASARADLRHVLLSSVFDAERRGAHAVVTFVRTLDGAGFETALTEHFAKAEAPAPPRPAPAPATRGLGSGPKRSRRPGTRTTAGTAGTATTGASAPPQPSARHLIADAFADGQPRSTTLIPDADHTLVVQVAIPAERQTHAKAAFPVAALPANASVELVVHVSSDDLGLRASGPIVLSTAERDAPSTQAAFPFRTRGENTVVDIKILVTHRNRPLQECHYVATVRRQAFPGEQPRINTIQLSSWPEPREATTAADVSLEVNGANLIRTETGRAVDLGQLRPLLDQIDNTASRALAADDAPETLEGEAARALLVKLARLGAQLKGQLAPLDIGDAATVSMLVDARTPVLPLELVYDAETPRSQAVLCEHRARGAAAGVAEACERAGRDVVCPLAFWGPHRVVARTIRLDGGERDRVPPAPLSLRPVLYAATTRADAGGAAAGKPSDVLEEELKRRAGAARVTRVQDWTAWARAVDGTHPQLLVVLGHTQSQGNESSLEIGAGSYLSSPDVTGEYLRKPPAAPPLVMLLACSTALPRDCFGGLPGAFAGGGAAAVIATLTKMHGPHGARAGVAIVRALFEHEAQAASTLGSAMTAARRQLMAEGLLVGLLLVSHGEIDLPLGQ